MCVAMEEEEAVSKLGSGEDESFLDCNPLITIVPLGMALSAEMHSGTELLCLDSTLDISNWVKHRIPGFSKLVWLPVSRHERLYTAYLKG